MAPRKDPSRIGKRVANTEISDAGSAQAETQREQTPLVIIVEEFRIMREEMRELRAENQALKEGMVMGVSQTSSPAPPPLHATTSKKTTRQRLNEGGVSAHEFLILKTPEFKG